jgi:superfamily I DNA/RNA helicase
MKTKRMKDNPDAAKDAHDDARWILGLSESDMALLETTLQREDIGIRISTIHRTKGMEFDAVLVSNVNERLKAETCVFYVASTRARERLVLA